MSLLSKHGEHSIGLIGHTVINYPTPELALASVDIMVEEGVSLIELQIPFSEPIADGPIFMQANHEALAAGVNMKQCFQFMQAVSRRHSIPFVFMSYANVLFKKGFADFVAAAQAVGAKGAIVPDLPVENASDYLAVW